MRTRTSQPPRFAGSITEDTGGGPDDLDLPESMPGGAGLVELQRLEHRLHEVTAEQPGDSMKRAAILLDLARVKQHQGHLTEALEHLKQSLQIQQRFAFIRAWPGGRIIDVVLFQKWPLATPFVLLSPGNWWTSLLLLFCFEWRRMEKRFFQPGNAATLHELGSVTAQTGDLKEALRYLKEDLRMKQSLHGDGDNPVIATTLHELGKVTVQTGDLKRRLRYLTWEMQLLHRNGNHPGIATTLHELGKVTAQTGDLKEALRYLKESLRMKQSLPWQRWPPRNCNDFA